MHLCFFPPKWKEISETVLLGSRTAGDVAAGAGAMEWEGEAYDKLVLKPVADVHGTGRRNGSVSEWYVAAYDLLVPARATACDVSYPL